MSFASDARKELTREAPQNYACARAELASALMALGAVSFRGMGRYSVSFTVDSASIIRYFFSLTKRHFGIVCELHTIRAAQLGRRMRYRLVVPNEAVNGLLEALDMRDEESLFGIRTAPSEALLAGEGCPEAFLRGAFMVCGSMTNPERAYSLEFAVSSDAMAGSIVNILRNYEIDVKINHRKEQSVVYLRGSEHIVDLLARIGAHTAMLEIENIRIQKQLLNLVNRQTNCDTHNIERQVQTAAAQIRDIDYIDEQIGLDRLPKSLRDIAEARRQFPYSSLTTLGEQLTPPIGKSGVNNRLRRLAAIAEKLRCGEEINL